MSFLPHYCHSFRITVIPSGLLSFLPNYCHSFCIIVIPSSDLPPIPEGRKNWPAEPALCTSFPKILDLGQSLNFPFLL